LNGGRPYCDNLRTRVKREGGRGAFNSVNDSWLSVLRRKLIYFTWHKATETRKKLMAKYVHRCPYTGSFINAPTDVPCADDIVNTPTTHITTEVRMMKPALTVSRKICAARGRAPIFVVASKKDGRVEQERQKNSANIPACQPCACSLIPEGLFVAYKRAEVPSM